MGSDLKVDINKLSSIRNNSQTNNTSTPTASYKNNDNKDTFVSKHKKAIIITSGVIGGLGALTAAFFLAKKGKLGAKLQNFTNGLFNKTADTAQNLSKTDITKPVSEVQPEIEKTVESLEKEVGKQFKKIGEANERLGKLSNDCLKLYGGKDGIQRLSPIAKKDFIGKKEALSIESSLMKTKARQLAKLYEEYKKIQAQADELYNNALEAIKKLPQKEQESFLKTLDFKIRMIREPHENAQAYNKIIDAVKSGDFFTKYFS